MSVAVSSKVAWWRGLVVGVVLLALFGWSAVFASSARADSHNGEIKINCRLWSVELNDYGDDENLIVVTVDGNIVVNNNDFGDWFFQRTMWTSTVDHRISVLVVDPEDPPAGDNGFGPRGWSFVVEETSPACDEPQIVIKVPVLPAATASTTTTTSVTVAPSTLPFTGATPVSPAVLAVVLLGSGVLVVLFARRAEDKARRLTGLGLVE